MSERSELPVYLFTGFLGSGKTTFIQDALGSEGFNDGEITLLLLCEEGETEYEPENFYTDDVYIERIEEEADLDRKLLSGLCNRCRATRVIIEWNGMWRLESLYSNMPANWLIYQQMMLAEASTFLLYNTNIRQQTFEQMAGAELVAFNRCVRDDDFEKWQLEVHKICRVANRRSQILYEFGEDDVLMDDIQDPLPYDMSKKLLQIGDEDFAEWYRDINDNQMDYEGKEVIIKGRAVVGDDLPEGKFIFGRHVMACCEEDIQFAGLLCKGNEDRINKLKNGSWIEIRARINIEYDDIYREEGPILTCSKITAVDPCDPEVATF